MSAILTGPLDPQTLSYESFGQILFDELEKCSNEYILIDIKECMQITYKELHEFTIKVALLLKRNFGIQKGDVISVIARNKWQYVITTIGAFYLGATINPINPDYSFEELKHACDISNPRLVICSGDLLRNVRPLQDVVASIREIMVFEGLFGDICNFNILLLRIRDSATVGFQPEKVNIEEDIALIMSSSGTTGVPKGVALTHANLRATMLYVIDPEFIDFNRDEVTVAFLPFFHIFGICLFCACVLAGTKCVIMERFNPTQFLEIIQNYRVSKLIIVPPILQFLLTSDLLFDYNLSSIRDIIVGSAPLGMAQERLAYRRLRIKVRQLYGLTELSGAVTCVPTETERYGSVGRPTTTHKIKFVTSENTLADPMQHGELYVKGGGLMKRYLGPVENPDDVYDDEGYFKTGDLGYYDEEGYVYIVDRIKEVIKCNGFQVPPTELENIIIRHPAVQDVAVIGKPDQRAGEVPVALVVREREVSEEDIKIFVANNICFQKQLHGGVRFVPEIPRSPSGKILRRELRRYL